MKRTDQILALLLPVFLVFTVFTTWAMIRLSRVVVGTDQHQLWQERGRETEWLLAEAFCQLRGMHAIPTLLILGVICLALFYWNALTRQKADSTVDQES